MQLPSIDRTPNLRPSGADAGPSVANRVIPVAPVNPSTASEPVQQEVSSVTPAPGVVNLVNPPYRTNNKPNEGEPVYTSVPDPSKSSKLSNASPRDWTIHRPAPEKVENPPPKPLSQVLMDHLRTVWNASASAIQVEQVNNMQKPPPLPPQATPNSGEVAKQALTYEPSKIKKTESL